MNEDQQAEYAADIVTRVEGCDNPRAVLLYIAIMEPVIAAEAILFVQRNHKARGNQCESSPQAS